MAWECLWIFLVPVVDGLEEGDWYRWRDSPVTARGLDTRDCLKILFRCPQIAYQPKMLLLTWKGSCLKKIPSLQGNEGKVQWGQQTLIARNICKAWFNLKLRSICWKQIIPAAEWGHSYLDKSHTSTPDKCKQLLCLVGHCLPTWEQSVQGWHCTGGELSLV